MTPVALDPLIAAVTPAAGADRDGWWSRRALKQR